MRTAVTIDDGLIEQARELTGVHDHAALIRAGLEALIRIESKRRLASLGGADPSAAVEKRRRPS